MKREHTKLAINYAELNWQHAAPGIRCKVDWAGASVYEFPRSHFGKIRILAYTLRDAVSTLEMLETCNDQKWDAENAGLQSIQETFA